MAPTESVRTCLKVVGRPWCSLNPWCNSVLESWLSTRFSAITVKAMSNPSPLQNNFVQTSGSSSATSENCHGAAFKPLSRVDVAKVLGVSIRTLDNWQRSGRLPRSVDIGGRAFWHPEVFYSWLDQTLKTTAPDTGTAPSLVKNAQPCRAPESVPAASRALARNAAKLAAMAAGTTSPKAARRERGSFPSPT